MVKAAEMLDLADTPKRLVALEPDGKQFVMASPPGRQGLWRQHLMRLRLFKDVYEALNRAPQHEIDKDFVLEQIILNMPQENLDRTFETFLHWSRFGDLFEYDDDREELKLAEQPAPAAT